MADLFPITLAELIAEAAREIRERERVYPRLIEGGTLSRNKADRRLAMMVEIHRTLVTLQTERQNR